jgi:hypothetical protein
MVATDEVEDGERGVRKTVRQQTFNPEITEDVDSS